MRWRKASPEDTAALIKLSREPMDGRVQLIWGFEALQAPVDCSDFTAYAVEEDETIRGMACSWLWPNGDRYLSGLRYAVDFQQRPRPIFWKQAYQDMLADVSHAWTCIGKENTRARRILESDVSWLPHYQARQEIRTWFVPLSRSQANTPKSEELETSMHLKTSDWRHVAIASGTGLAYRTGRLSHQLGFPGIPPSGRRMRIAYYAPTAEPAPEEIRRSLSGIHGYDGLVVVLPKDSDAAKRWEVNRPRLAWTWDSTLYAVSWDKSALGETLPEWKGLWL